MRYPQFAKEFRSSLLALLFNLGGVISGSLLGYYLGVFTLTRWALIAFPGIMSVRGVIGGQFSGKMTSGLHVGFIRPTIRGNTKEFQKLVNELVLLGFSSTLLLSATNILFYYFSYGFDFYALAQLVVTIQSTMCLSLITVSPVTVLIAILTFKRGLDPDKMTYPIISTVADIMVAGSFVLMILAVQSLVGFIIIGFISLVFTVISLRIFQVNRLDKIFVKEFKTSLSVLLAVSVIVAVTGSVLDKMTSIVGSRREIYVIYPAILNTVGDSGAIVGSTTTTKLIIGEVEPNLTIFRGRSVQISATWLVSFILFLVYVLLSMLITGGVSLEVFSYTWGVLIITNLLSVGVIMCLGLLLAVITFKRELNPDSFVIPLQTNVADMLTTIVLAFTVAVLV